MHFKSLHFQDADSPDNRC